MTTAPKPGSPGRYAKPFRARHVEDQPCETRGPGATHLLINSGETVVCCGCRVLWAELDRVLNGRAS